ncbi:MAG: OmpA family protein [Tannerellaceae bacterium]
MKKVVLAVSVVCASVFMMTSCHSKKDMMSSAATVSSQPVQVIEDDMAVAPVTVEVAKITGDQMKVQEEALVKALALVDVVEADGDTIVTVDLVPDLKNGQLQAIKLGLNDSVLFKINSAELSTKADSVLSVVAANMQDFPQTDATVIGYTSHTGPQEFNQELSVKRAQAVMKYLATKGVATSRMEAIGKGWNDPVATNKTWAGRALNRRVEIFITVGEQMIESAKK